MRNLLVVILLTEILTIILFYFFTKCFPTKVRPRESTGGNLFYLGVIYDLGRQHKHQLQNLNAAEIIIKAEMPQINVLHGEIKR